MARLFFYLLLFVNLVVWVWSAGYLGGREDGREPDRLLKQLDPVRLKVRVGDLPAEPVAVPAQVSLLAGSCRRTGSMATVEADTLAKRIVAAGGSATLTAVEAVSYWVFIPAIDGKPAEKDIAVLRKTGFKEFSVVGEEGPNLNAVSLGHYATDELAQEKMARLTRNGIKSAKIATLTKSTGQAQLLVRGAPAILDKALAGVATEPAECLKE